MQGELHGQNTAQNLPKYAISKTWDPPTIALNQKIGKELTTKTDIAQKHGCKSRAAGKRVSQTLDWGTLMQNNCLPDFVVSLSPTRMA